MSSLIMAPLSLTGSSVDCQHPKGYVWIQIATKEVFELILPKHTVLSEPIRIHVYLYPSELSSQIPSFCPLA